MSKKREAATGDDKKRAHPKANFYSYELLNAMSRETCQRLWAAEKRDRVTEASNGCWLTTRALFPGSYAIIQIPIADVPALYADAPKGQLKVAVHQLAWRAQGKLVPAYDKGEDLMHLCGNGKARSKDDRERGCVNPAHLAIGDHADNMSAQRCKPIVDCHWCCMPLKVCTHTPQCVGTAAEEHRLSNSPKPTSVTITYDDGSTKTFSFASSSSAAASSSAVAASTVPGHLAASHPVQRVEDNNDDDA